MARFAPELCFYSGNASGGEVRIRLPSSSFADKVLRWLCPGLQEPCCDVSKQVALVDKCASVYFIIVIIFCSDKKWASLLALTIARITGYASCLFENKLFARQLFQNCLKPVSIVSMYLDNHQTTTLCYKSKVCLYVPMP